MSVIFPFISTFYLKQQTSILRCFCSLKFEYILFSNKLFRCVFRSKRTIYTAENDQIKYFAQNELVKITFLYLQTISWLCCYYCKLRFFKFVESFKNFSPLRQVQILDMYYTMNDQHIRLNTFSKHEKMGLS